MLDGTTEERNDDWTMAHFEGASYVRGASAGLMGAMAVMGFQGFGDAMQGQLFATPSLFGSLLFKGEAVLAFDPTMTLAYTLVHFGLFTALGILAARVMRTDLRDMRSEPLVVGLALALFGVTTAFLAVMALIFSPTLFDDLGTLALLSSNAVASIVMSGVLVAMRAPRPVQARF